MTEDDLESCIEKTIRDVSRVYDMAFSRFEELKDILNTLEQTSTSSYSRQEALDSVANSISEFSDSMLMVSKNAWLKYRRLESESEGRKLGSARLDEMHAWCVKIEGFASDLLCYSLGRLKHEDQSQRSSL